MASSEDSQGFVAIFLLIAALIGAATGSAIGAALAGSVSLRLLAIVAAISAIIVLGVVRSGLGKSFPTLLLARRGFSVPLVVWISALYSAVVGGLAGHDFGQFVGVPSAAITGFFSGTIATVSMATLMILYFKQHPENGVEF
jgi:hypothetical protein